MLKGGLSIVKDIICRRNICVCIWGESKGEKNLTVKKCSAKKNLGAFYKLILLHMFIFLSEILKGDCSIHLIIFRGVKRLFELCTRRCLLFLSLKVFFPSDLAFEIRFILLTWRYVEKIYSSILTLRCLQAIYLQHRKYIYGRKKTYFLKQQNYVGESPMDRCKQQMPLQLLPYGSLGISFVQH